jgi:pantoate--beta-alanine ligase
MPEVIEEIAPLCERLRQIRRVNSSVGLVPTMGALHAGHEKLLETARRENDCVVASIFVNPLQFNRNEDLATYPRMMDADLRVCERCGVDLVFSPAEEDLYPREQLTFVDSPSLSAHLCGEHRPGHFRGVATIVLKLLNLVQPDRAYFGEKDAQQLAIIRRMVLDLNVPVTIVPIATFREADGLALSSRNKLLTAQQRQIAPILYRALRKAIEEIEGGQRSAAAIRDAALSVVSTCPEARVEYFEITDPEILAPVEQVKGSVLIAAAIWLGSTRLIDNVLWSGEAPSIHMPNQRS